MRGFFSRCARYFSNAQCLNDDEQEIFSMSALKFRKEAMQ
jgi:hypothetical protein